MPNTPPVRFAPINEATDVIRLVNPNGNFFPPGSVFPLPEWLNPTRADEAEGMARQRVAGLSVWDHSRTTVAQAKAFLNRPDDIAFSIAVTAIRQAGNDNDVDLAVVADPRDDLAPQQGWDGHALIEGLKRPPGQPKARYKTLWAVICESAHQVA